MHSQASDIILTPTRQTPAAVELCARHCRWVSQGGIAQPPGTGCDATIACLVTDREYVWGRGFKEHASPLGVSLPQGRTCVFANSFKTS
jgi:hypothetical protein